MWKSILAVTAGILALTLTSFAIEWMVNPLLMRLFPATLPDIAALAANTPVRAFTLAYSLLCVALGGYLCARLASHSPLRHALAMGIVQAGMTLLAMLSMPEIASVSQWIITAILAFPASAAGGLFFLRRRPNNRPVKTAQVKTAQ